MSPPGREILYGRNPVMEALRAGRRRVHRLFLAEGVQVKGALRSAIAQARSRGLPIETLARGELDRFHTNHQGLAAETDPYPYAAIDEILIRAQKAGEPPLILLLDSLQDPQNLGTLLRTAEAVGVHGVVLPGHHSAGVTPAVVRASSGATEHLLIAVANLAQAMRRLKEAGVWFIGLEASGEASPLASLDLGGPLGLVVGSEATGMRRLVRQACDHLSRLPMRGRVESLNAAVAGSVALYAIWAARGYAGRPSPASGDPDQGARIDAPWES